MTAISRRICRTCHWRKDDEPALPARCSHPAVQRAPRGTLVLERNLVPCWRERAYGVVCGPNGSLYLLDSAAEQAEIARESAQDAEKRRSSTR